MSARDDATGVEALIAVSQRANDPKSPAPGAVPYVVLPTNATVKSLEDLLPHPASVNETVTLRTAAGFIDYVQTFKTAATRVFGDAARATVTAVIDYHFEQPDWCRHRATLAFRPTPEWTTWMGLSGRHLSQVDFAAFIEDNLPDIADPAGADILDVTRSLEAKKSVEFRSSIRLQDGSSQLTYDETVVGKGRGNLMIPEEFTLGLAPYEGSDVFKVIARLRYRITEGRLELWYDLRRPHTVLEQVFTDAVTAVQAGLEITAWLGSRST